MNTYKNANSINEVKKVLERFQEAYTKKDVSELDEVVEGLFSTKKGQVALGSGMGQWCFNNEELKKLISSHWKKEDNYWKEIDFKFEKAKMFANENVAWVVSIGNIKNTISEDEQAAAAIENIKSLLITEESSNEKALNAAYKIAISLKEIDKGEDYIWPFRFTSVLIKENDVWKFHHIQFSLDSAYFWQYRFTTEEYDESLFQMPQSDSSEAIEEVKKTLQLFQDGYTKRDVSYVDEYMKELFALDEEQVVIGTDADELCIGSDNIKGIVESDWKYWGDFKLNVNEALISVSDDVAYFTTKAMIARVTSKEKILEWLSGTTDYFLKSEGKAKSKLLEVLCGITMFLHESERGEIYKAPMRFSGVLVKVNDKWKIHHLQYSDYIDGMPQARK